MAISSVVVVWYSPVLYMMGMSLVDVGVVEDVVGGGAGGVDGGGGSLDDGGGLGGCCGAC